MAGNSLGQLKSKLGITGTPKTGEMISRMNAMKKDFVPSKIASAKVRNVSKVASNKTKAKKVAKLAVI